MSTRAPTTTAASKRLARQLDEYFAGERTEFDVTLSEHGTPFELGVWNALREIPYGETRSYGDLAASSAASPARSAAPTAATRSRSSCPATA